MNVPGDLGREPAGDYGNHGVGLIGRRPALQSAEDGASALLRTAGPQLVARAELVVELPGLHRYG